MVSKDFTASIIQFWLWKSKVESAQNTSIHYTIKDFINNSSIAENLSGWEIRRFADKLKDMVCMLIGCTREQLEDREFKEKELGEEWWYWKLERDGGYSTILLPYNESTGTENYTLVKPTPRLLMQLLGTECGRQILHPNVWVNALMNDYKPTLEHQKDLFDLPNVEIPDAEQTTWIQQQYPNWIIPDVRFPNELKAVKDRAGITIRVNRPDFVENSITGEKFPVKIHRKKHLSETSLDNAEFDYIIDNSGTIADLEDKVLEILKKERIC